jgi:hypothetical protein
MANEEHIRLLKRGVAQWNMWRRKYPEIWPDLSGADLSGADLSGADLIRARLSEAELDGAKLSGANLGWADLSGADLSREDLSRVGLSGADLGGSNLSGANLCGAGLSGTNLSWANLRGADLRKADLSTADLSMADLSSARLSRANLYRAVLGHTRFAHQDLTQVRYIETIQHSSSSSIDFTTVILPPMSSSLSTFLRGTAQSPYLIAALQGTELPLADVFVNVLLTYIESDREFADGLRPHLKLLQSVTLVEESVPLSSREPWQRDTEAWQNTHLMVVLVSAPFLTSPIVVKQILEPELLDLKNGIPLVPVIVRPVNWQGSLLQRLQPAIQGWPVSRWSDRDDALHAIAEELQPVVQHLYAKLLGEASRRRQRDLLLAQLIQARTTSVEQRERLKIAQTQVQRANKAVANAEEQLQEAQRHLQEAREALQTHTQQKQELQQCLTTLQQTETNLLAHIKELNRTPDEETSSE